MSSTYCKKVTLSRVRVPSVEDRSRIYCRLVKLKSKMREFDIAKFTDPAYTTEMIVLGGMDAVIIDEAFLLVYSVCSPWYSERVFLQECLVLRIGNGSSMSAVCDMLDDLADEHQVDDILVGTALAMYPRALARMYKARGYKELPNPSLIKRRE